MGWELFFVLFLVAFLLLLLLRVPVAVALFAVSVGGGTYLFGFDTASRMTTGSVLDTLATFSLAPVPLFILLGEFLFKFGIAQRALESLDDLLGMLPGRLAILSTVSGALLGMVSGSPMASTAVLTGSLVPTMEEKGYSPRLAMGSVLASGGLSMIIPPSALAVIWGSTAGVPIGPLLIAGVVPGIVMALFYLLISIGWAKYASGAPEDETADRGPLGPRLRDFAKYVLPLGVIVFLVVGLIMLGVATPTESAATGVLGALILVFAYGRFDLRTLWRTLTSSAAVVGMIFFIIASAGIFGQIMAGSGASRGLIQLVVDNAGSALAALLVMLGLTVFLGLFLAQIAIVVVTVPFFMPVVESFGIHPVWFGILMLIALQIGLTTPPLGMSLFVMKGILPGSTRIQELYWAAAPFVLAGATSLALLIAIPGLVLWLPEALF